MDDDERILRQRAQVLRLTSLGQSVSYVLLLLAMVFFFVGLVVGFNGAFVVLVCGSLGLAAVILAPSIIFSYAAKAADRFEKTGKTGH